MILQLLDGKVLRAKFTVEERADGIFISTEWRPENGYEEDRLVEEFETYSGALCHMYEQALNEALCWTNLKKVVSQ